PTSRPLTPYYRAPLFRFRSRFGLPDAAGVHRRHRRTFLTAERIDECGLVHDHAVDSILVGRMWISKYLVADGLWPSVLAVVLRVPDKEPLRTGEPVDLLFDVDAGLLRSPHVGHEGEQKSAVVGRVLAEG